MLSRRQILGAGLAGAALAGCSRFARELDGERLPEHLDLPPGEIDPAVRLLDRAGFGPRPGQVAEVQTVGVERWLDQQLSPEGGEPRGLNFQLNRLTVLQIDGMELRDMPENQMLRELSQAAILRAVYSPWQVRERMVDFWTNHFNIYGRKGLASYRKPADDVNVIRDHALDTFPALLKASAHSPAMLAYLDNRQNVRGVANENYARELMELHALGVHGGYTQKDVQEVARCFTGWTVEDRFLHHHGAFRYDEGLHDDGAKVVLGVTIPAGGGQHDGERVLDILSSHPSCARFIATKLVGHFLGVRPLAGALSFGGGEMQSAGKPAHSQSESRWIDRLAKIYQDTGGSIPAMLQPLLLSEEALSGPPVAKRPFDYIVSAFRALDADTDGGPGVQRELQAMGQPLFEWPMPDGYPDKTSAWTGSLLARWNFALKLTQGRLDNASIDLARLQSRLQDKNPSEAMAELILPGRPAERIKKALTGSADTPVGAASQSPQYAAAAALCLCSPEFQWR